LKAKQSFLVDKAFKENENLQEHAIPKEMRYYIDRRIG